MRRATFENKQGGQGALPFSLPRPHRLPRPAVLLFNTKRVEGAFFVNPGFHLPLILLMMLMIPLILPFLGSALQPVSDPPPLSPLHSLTVRAVLGST